MVHFLNALTYDSEPQYDKLKLILSELESLGEADEAFPMSYYDALPAKIQRNASTNAVASGGINRAASNTSFAPAPTPVVVPVEHDPLVTGDSQPQMLLN